MNTLDQLAAAVVSNAVAPQGLNPLRLFLDADIVVQVVMVGLLLASLWVWTIIIAFSLKMASVRRASGRFEAEFWASDDPEAMLARTRGETPTARVASAGLTEFRKSTRNGVKNAGQALARIAQAMEGQVASEADKLSARLGFLATTGSVAPFIGLFGTVWGIMVSFQAIANSQNTSLNVVAPGIAEALFATAIGLVAAIPATIFYNMFSSDAGKIGARLENFADEFSAIISRQLDERV